MGHCCSRLARARTTTAQVNAPWPRATARDANDAGGCDEDSSGWQPRISRTATKQIRDPVFQFITLTRDELRVIDTPEFQRLKNLRQLSVTHFVFPSATH